VRWTRSKLLAVYGGVRHTENMNDQISPARYLELLNLQEKLNEQLHSDFAAQMFKGREHLAKFLVHRVESLVDELNEDGFSFGRCDYDGDVNFENSGQTYSDSKVMGEGVILHFLGYSVQVSWEGSDKYA
jgi:hypothetical protein